MPVLYICEPCHEGAPEMCGYLDRKEIRIMPNGVWLCNQCFDEYAADHDVEPLNEDGDMPLFSAFPMPREYKPHAHEALETIRTTFQRDIEQGYITKDKEFAVAVANAALSGKEGG